MKNLKIFVIAAFALFATAASFATESDAPKEDDKKIEWLTLEEAYRKNQEEPRKIFIDVYTNWCGWCKKMDKDTFSDEEVAEYANDNYYAVKLNAESDRIMNLGDVELTEREIARQLQVRSYPTIVFMQEDFKNFQPVPGYRTADDFKNMLEKFNVPAEESEEQE
ncbi:thioredoxin family protein [Roseivirga sp. BDSF3-8]|uniref:thioredoxin family protein n=1 Tax=Roseivirga sp. BDSF3-8 TaxID=3241598 RepID=UPI003531EE2C